MPYSTSTVNNEVHGKAAVSKAVSSTQAQSNQIPPDSTKKVSRPRGKISSTNESTDYTAVLVHKVKKLCFNVWQTGFVNAVICYVQG